MGFGRSKAEKRLSPEAMTTDAFKLCTGPNGLQAGVTVSDFRMQRGNKGGKNGMMGHVNLTLRTGFNQDPRRALAHLIGEALKRANQICPVKQYPERIGEVHNLKDHAAQMRSKAAIFIKKYRFFSRPLSVLYSSLRRRELSVEECEEVLAITYRIGPEDKERCIEGWLKIMEQGGEDAHLKGHREENNEPDSNE